MTVAEQHSAGASFAGFALQLDRALVWLAQAKLGGQVAIESLDDVVMQEEDGKLHLEQDKLSFRRNPVTDRSPNLWKTLGIWIDLIKSGECELDDCQFYLVTNQKVSTGIAALLRDEPARRDKHDLLNRVLLLASSPSQDWRMYSVKVLETPKDLLSELLDRIMVIDEAPFGELRASNDHLRDKLLLTAEIADSVIESLRGWLLGLVVEHFAQAAQNKSLSDRSPAWVGVDLFRDYLHRLISRLHDDRLFIRAAKEISVTEEQTQAAKTERFVRQLEIINFDADYPEDFIDCIIDFLRSKEERTRLAEENAVTKIVFNGYEQELIDRWKIERRSASRLNTQSEEHTGQAILDNCLKFQPQLDGHDIPEGYLPRGTYHSLANSSASNLGWHPRHRQLL